MKMAKTNATILIVTDSFKNCFMRFDRLAPNVFLIPISGARIIPCAVVKFMKFIQANSKTKSETKEKIRISETEPLILLSSQILLMTYGMYKQFSNRSNL